MGRNYFFAFGVYDDSINFRQPTDYVADGIVEFTAISKQKAKRKQSWKI